MMLRPIALPAALLGIAVSTSAMALSLPSALEYNGHAGYLGADYSDDTLTIKNNGYGGFPLGHYDARSVDFRAGWRWLNAASLEVHYGVPVSGTGNGSVQQTAAYGAYLVPTASILSLVELALPIGYSHVRLNDDAGHSFGLWGVSFGARLELPLGRLAPSLAGLRFSGGGMLYQSRSSVRYYAFGGGLRYDFSF